MLFAGTASAQQAWTLQECLDYALQHNIQVQKNRISEERGEVSLWQDKGALSPVSASVQTTAWAIVRSRKSLTSCRATK